MARLAAWDSSISTRRTFLRLRLRLRKVDTMTTALPRKSSWLALLASVGTITAQSPFWTYTTRFQDC